MNNLNIFNGAKVLITGHTGFKGTWLSLWLSYLGAQVCGVSDDIPTTPSNFLASNLTSYIKEDHRVDIRSALELAAVVDKFQPDFVFHLAAQALVRRSYIDPIETWQINTLGTVNLLDALKKIKKKCTVVMITSDKCYDNVEWPWGYRETDRLGGPDPYSASKGAAELAIKSYVKSFFSSGESIRVGIGRAGNVIGGGDWAEDRIIPDCMRAASKGMAVELRNPLATRPWQHVLEPLSGYLNLAMELHNNSMLHSEAFNFGPPAEQNYAVGDLVLAMSKFWDKIKYEDISSQYGGPYESNLLKLNCDKALHYLKWHALWDFKDTIEKTVLWYREYYEGGSQSIASFTISQIENYMSDAVKKKLNWAL